MKAAPFRMSVYGIPIEADTVEEAMALLSVMQSASQADKPTISVDEWLRTLPSSESYQTYRD